MPTYSVVAVGDNVRTWKSGKGEDFKAYRVTLRNAEGREMPNVEWSRKATMPAPEIGLKVDGTVETDVPYGPRLKEPYQGGRGGGGGSRPRDPAERKAIAMQASHKVAVDAARLAIDAGVLKVSSPEDVSAAVQMFASQFYNQVEGVAK